MRVFNQRYIKTARVVLSIYIVYKTSKKEDDRYILIYYAIYTHF